jgi:molybdenum cofactor cytidylyltransferase
VDEVLASAAARVEVVTGFEAEPVRSALAGRALDFAHNPEPGAGMAASLRIGILALGESLGGVLVCLADMPWVRAAHLDALISAFEARADRPICVPCFERQRGNPVLWPARHFAAIAALEGDRGARSLLAAHAAEVCYVPVADAGVTRDVDTPEALAALRQEQDEAR